MKKFFGLLLLTILMMACSKTVNQYAGIYQSTFGGWTLVKTGGGICSTCVFPVIGNNTLSLNADSTFEYKRNDTLLSSGKFSIRTGKSIYSANDTTLIYFSNQSSGSIITVKNDSLILLANVYDPTYSIYIHKQ